jgi:hypothetical protein
MALALTQNGRKYLRDDHTANNPEDSNFLTHLPMKMEQTVCSETSTYKIQTPGNYPEKNIHHLQHGESLKSKIIVKA